MLATRFGKGLSFQARLTLVAAAAVAVAVAASAVVIYWGVRTVVLGEVDSSLKQRADGTTVREGLAAAPARPGSGAVFELRRALSLQVPPDPGGSGGLVQAVDGDGQVVTPPGQVETMPISARDRQVASGDADPFYRDDLVHGAPYRIYTSPISDSRAAGEAIEVGRPLVDAQSVLDILKLFLGAVSLGGIVLAAVLGRLIAKAALGPVYRLRTAVDHVTATRDMSRRVPDEGTDELGRLSSHFNRMLEALDQSLRSQRQLVADASHELRTPLASLRTNIEVLHRSPDMRGPDRDPTVRPDLRLRRRRQPYPSRASGRRRPYARVHARRRHQPDRDARRRGDADPVPARRLRQRRPGGHGPAP